MSQSLFSWYRDFDTSNRGLFFNVPLTFVMGNEAADLDSVISSIVYCFLLHLRFNLGGVHEPTQFRPVINIPRREFSIHTESVFVLKQVGMSPENLLFSDDLKDFMSRRPSFVSLVLVDHNRLNADQTDLAHLVEEVRRKKGPSPCLQLWYLISCIRLYCIRSWIIMLMRLVSSTLISRGSRSR